MPRPGLAVGAPVSIPGFVVPLFSVCCPPLEAPEPTLPSAPSPPTSVSLASPCHSQSLFFIFTLGIWPSQHWGPQPTCLWSHSHSQCCLHQGALLACPNADKNPLGQLRGASRNSHSALAGDVSGHPHLTDGLLRLGTGSHWP